MAEEMLFTVAGSVAMPAQMISLEEAGLEQRADLQEWVLSNPAILGPAVKVVTFEFDGLPDRPAWRTATASRCWDSVPTAAWWWPSSRAAGPPTPR